MNKKKLFLWCLYDFANSIVFINFLLYFGQWLVIDGGLGDFWYNAIFAIATVLLLFSAPILAAYTDIHGHRKLFLNSATVGTFISYSMAAFLAAYTDVHVFLVAFFFLIGQYFYQLSFVFYNPLLEEIADVEHRSRASGIGQFSNSLGQVLGLVMTLPLSGSRVAPLLPAVGVFFILALPMMIFFKENKKDSVSETFSVLKLETKNYVRRAIQFFTISLSVPMLVSFFFFNDALITLSNNYPIYMERVFGISDSLKSILLMSILVMSALGGIIAGWLGDKFGPLKILKIILGLWIILLPLMAIASNVATLAILTAITGLLIGSVWTVTRAYLSTVLKQQEMGYGFSFYTLMERFATFVGPLTWGAVVALGHSEPIAYRIAVATMTVFVAIGLVILVRWKKGVSRV